MPLREQIEDELITLWQDRIIFRLRREFAVLRGRVSTSEENAEAAQDFAREADEDLMRVNRLISTAEARLRLRLLSAPPE